MISRRDALKLGAAGMIAQPLALATSDLEAKASSMNTLLHVTVTAVPEITGPRLDRSIVVKWRFEAEGERYAPPRATQDAVYLGGDTHTLHAINAVTGNERWQINLSSGSAWSTPAVANGVLFYTRYGRSGRSFDASLHAIDATTGDEVWAFVSSSNTMHTPVVANGVVYVGTNYTLYAVDTTNGEVRWTFSDGADFRSIPLVVDGVVYTGNQQNALLALDAQTGEEQWRFSMGGQGGTPVTSNGSIFVGADDGIFYSLDAITGAEKWRFYHESGQITQPSASNGIVCFDSVSLFYALDINTGEVRWQFPVNAYIRSSVATEDIIYLSANNLYAIDAISGQVLWNFPSDSSSYTTFLTVAEGVVYVDGTTLWAISNLPQTVLAQDVTLRGGPAETSIERGRAKAGTEISNTGARESSNSQIWVEVMIGDVTGWIPLDAIDPATLPPDGEIEYVYVPG